MNFSTIRVHITNFREWYLSIGAALLAVLLIQGVVFAATTISTNVSTDGNLTVSGNTTLGDAATDRAIFTGTLQASTTALFTSGFTTYGNWTIDRSATTTVTFNQRGINFDSNTFVINPDANRVGILTANPRTALDVVGTASTTRVIAATSVGVASTTPYVALGVTGTTTSSAGMTIGALGSKVTALRFGTCTFDPASMNASTTRSTNCTSATGVRANDRVFVTLRSMPNGIVFVSASSTADNVIQITISNTGWGPPNGAAINVPSTQIDWMSLR